MNTRMDHASAAVGYLHPDSYQPEKAQVHATLALAEQQRIANLIQLMHVPTGDLSDPIKDALHKAFPSNVDWESELREGVGIA